MKLVPLIGSPPMPTHVLWPMPARVSWYTTSYVSVPGAADDADVAGRADAARDDADLALPRRDEPRAVRAEQARALLLHVRPARGVMSRTGTPSVMQTTSFTPAAAASIIASAANSGGT